MALAEAMKRLLIDGALQNRLAERALLTASTQLSWTSIANKTVAVYDRARKRRKGELGA